MLPDIDNRINNIIKSLETTIMPALDPNNSLANEQAALAVGHLKLLLAQWDNAFLFERQNLQLLAGAAQQLVALADGGEHTMAAADAVATALAAQANASPENVATLMPLYIGLGDAVDNFIRACETDGSDACRAALETVVLDYGQAQAVRERTWFKATGLDPNAAALGSIADMLAAQG